MAKQIENLYVTATDFQSTHLQPFEIIKGLFSHTREGLLDLYTDCILIGWDFRAMKARIKQNATNGKDTI